MAKRKLAEPEKFPKIILDLGQFRVIIEESKRGYVDMRRFVNGNYQKKALGFSRAEIRDERGAIRPETIVKAKEKATAWYRQLTGAEATPEAKPLLGAKLLLIGEAWPLISDPLTGQYPHRTQFRDELKHALEFAAVTWGPKTPWSAIDSNDLTKLLRSRLSEQVRAGLTGVRSTEITVSRVLTAVNWLRQKKLIPMEAALIQPKWRKELKKYWVGLTKEATAPEPFRPAFTDEELGALLTHSWEIDPRFGLMFTLGFALRLGQVGRAKRSHLDITKKPNTFTSHGAGDKKGETIYLDKEERRAVDRALNGYLRELEAAYQAGKLADYPLFPAYKMFGKKGGDPVVPVNAAWAKRAIAPNTIRKWYRATETLAGVKRITGRGAYGGRRRSVDSGLEEGISEQGLKNLGGWTSSDVPRNIYAEKENLVGRTEASSVRTAIRRKAIESAKAAAENVA